MVFGQELRQGAIWHKLQGATHRRVVVDRLTVLGLRTKEDALLTRPVGQILLLDGLELVDGPLEQ